jgi:hypothetical protein
LIQIIDDLKKANPSAAVYLPTSLLSCFQWGKFIQAVTHDGISLLELRRFRNPTRQADTMHEKLCMRPELRSIVDWRMAWIRAARGKDEPPSLKPCWHPGTLSRPMILPIIFLIRDQCDVHWKCYEKKNLAGAQDAAHGEVFSEQHATAPATTASSAATPPDAPLAAAAAASHRRQQSPVGSLPPPPPPPPPSAAAPAPAAAPATTASTAATPPDRARRISGCCCGGDSSRPSGLCRRRRRLRLRRRRPRPAPAAAPAAAAAAAADARRICAHREPV